MQRIELKYLLPAGTVADRSRTEVLEDLVTGPAVITTTPESASRAGMEGPSNVAPGMQPEPAKDVVEQMSALTSQITSLISTQETQVGATQDNTQALAQNTSTKSGSSAGSAVGSIASNIVGGGWALSPLISSLIGLFSGRSGASEVTLAAPFQLPASFRYDAGITGTGPGATVPVSYNAAGQPRAETASPTPQVTVQVNAIDSQSFLDRSDDIARAVKEALLTSNALNDVIAEL